MATPVLFNEMDGFDTITTIANTALDTSAGLPIAGVSRGGFYIDNGSNLCIRALPAVMTTGWVHLVMKGRPSPTNHAIECFRMRDSGGLNLFTLGHDSSVTNAVTGLAAGAGGRTATLFSGGIATTVDINFKIADSGGFFDVYINGAATPAYSFAGDTKPGAGLGLFDLVFTASQTGNTASTVRCSYTQIMVSDETTLGGRVHSLPLAAFGAVNNWSGALADINAHALVDTTYLTAGAVNDDVLFTKGTMAALQSGFRIAGVGMGHRSSYVTGSAVTKTRQRAKVGAATYNGTTSQLALTAAAFSQTMDVNPATGVAWSVADVNAAEFGLQALA